MTGLQVLAVITAFVCIFLYTQARSALKLEKEKTDKLTEENTTLKENADIAEKQLSDLDSECVSLRKSNGQMHVKVLDAQSKTNKAEELAEKRQRVLDQSGREITNLKRKVTNAERKVEEVNTSHGNLKIEFTNLMNAHKVLKDTHSAILRPKTNWDDIVQLDNETGAKKKRFIVTGTVVLTQNEINLIKKRNLAHISTKEDSAR